MKLLLFLTVILFPSAATYGQAISQQPSESLIDDQSSNPAQFDWLVAFAGPDIQLGAGFLLEGHHLLATTYIRYISLGSPFLIPFTVGAQWRYNDWKIWPRYMHWLPLNPNLDESDFILGDFGQGARLEISWNSVNEQYAIALSNALFYGNLRLPNISQQVAFYDELRGSIALYRNSTFRAEDSIYLNVAGGLLVLISEGSIGYGAEVALPIRIRGTLFRITPVFKYAAHSDGALIKQSNSIGYNFSEFSTFDRGGLISLPRELERLSKEGEIVMALSLEGRWHFLEQLYLPILSGIYLKAFTDVAYVVSLKTTDSGNFNIATGGGVGLEWSNLSLDVAVGWEYGVGARFVWSINSNQ